MCGVMGGKSKHKATFAMQKLLSLRKAWGTGQERHACDLGHLQACMPAEGITPLAEGMAHHPVDPGAVHLLHKGTTTACDMYTDLMSCLQFACKHQLCAHMNCECVCHTEVNGRETSITLCTKSAGYQALLSAAVSEPERQAEDATSAICHAQAAFRQHQSWQMSRRLPLSSGCCITGGSCPRTAWSQGFGQT